MDLTALGLYDDSAVIDDTETVTLYDADGDSQTVNLVLKRDATLEDFADEPALLEQQTTAFHLWAENLAGAVPAKGWKVRRADDSVWHVTRVQTLDQGRRYRVACFLER